MLHWRGLTRGWKALINRSTSDEELADELDHYLEQATAAHIERGLSSADAARAARLEVGGVASVTERVRSHGWENVVRTTAADMKYAVRGLRSNAGYTAITVLTFALGLGGATAIFSAIHPILLEPLPYPEADRVAMISEVDADGSRIDGSFGMYHHLSSRSRTFEAMAVLRAWQPTRTGADRPERLEGQQVSASYFQVLGVSPQAGRAFDASEDQAGGPAVVVLSDAFWRSRLGSDPDIVGGMIMLDHREHRVLGIMPADFEDVLAPEADVWAPLQYGIQEGRAWGHHLRTVGRLRPGADVAQATRELDALGTAVVDELQPVTYRDEVRFALEPLSAAISSGVRPALLAVAGAVLLLLLIACVNVTNLVLARQTHRHGEFGLRAALGAGQGRLMRLVVVESLILALMGGLAGMAVALAGIQALVALSPGDLPRVDAIRLNGAVFTFALSLTTLVGLVCGIIPSVGSARTDPQAALKVGSRSGGPGTKGGRKALVVSQVALALVLLVTSGLLFRSLDRLFAVDMGFDAARLLTMQVQTSSQGPGDRSDTERFFARAIEAVQRVPGVESAALTSQLPLSGDIDQYGVEFETALETTGSVDPGSVGGAFRYAVSPDYFETMRIPLRDGRLLDASDRAGAEPVAVISESLARRRLPGVDPLGQRLRIGAGTLYTVVGVVQDVKQESLAGNEASAVYVTTEQWRFADNGLSVIVRAGAEHPGDPAALAPAVREAIWSIDGNQPVVRVATMDQLVAASVAERRFVLIVFQAFALVAILLTMAGIYGLLSGSVAERTREIGVRSALGATRTNVLALVLRQGMVITGIGILVGIAGALAASRAIESLLFGVSPLDAPTYVGVTVALIVIALIACGVPAWRACRIDPATTLRMD